MEFKGSNGEWKCVFTADNTRAIRNEGGLLMTFWKPDKYEGQDERYDSELTETKANQLLCFKSKEMLELLKEVYNMCDKMKFPTETELKEMAKKTQKLIKEATDQ